MTNTLTVSSPGTVLRTNTEATWAPAGTEVTEHSPLLSIAQQGDEFYVSGPNDSFWQILRGHEVSLFEGAVVKLGRVSLRVKAVRTPDSMEHDTQDSSEEESELERAGRLCKICLGDEDEANNPLIKPCCCTGSIQYIHLECLQKWIDSRKTVAINANCANYYWKSAACELCKQRFPEKILRAGQVVELLQRDHQDSPYIMLEPYEECKYQGVYLVSFLGSGPVKLGRGHDCDIRIPDISVSRSHAVLTFSDAGCTLQDNASKFGSLLLKQGPVKLETGECLSIQVGRSVLKVSKT